jgi:single-strand DNA-binding protein
LDQPAEAGFLGGSVNDINVHLVGNVVTDVTLRFTKAGDPVATFRVAVPSRRFDRAAERWVDGESQFFSVTCWRQLARNVLDTLGKGMPIVIVGRIRSRDVERPCGETSHTVRYVDVEATSVGPDLARGVATFERVKRESVIRAEKAAVAEALRGADSAA